MMSGGLGRATYELATDDTALQRGLSRARADVLSWVNGIDAQIEIKADIDRAQRDLTRIQRVTAEVDTADATIEVDAATGEVLRELSNVQRAANQLDGDAVRVRAIADTDRAQMALLDLRSMLQRMDDDPVTIEMRHNIDEVRGKLADLRGDLSGVNRITSGASGGLRGMAASSGVAAAAFTGLGSAIGGVGRTALGFAAGIGIYQAATQGLGAAFNFVKGAAIDMNASLETTTLQFETLMGDADRAREHVAGLFEFAKRTPFETGPIIEASRTLQVFGGDVLNTTETLTLLGDSAAAVNAPFEELAFWVGRAYSMIQGGQPFGEAAMRLQELAVLTPQARQEMERLQQSGASAAEIWNVFTASLQRNAGAMERQATTWRGLTSTLRDWINLTAANLLAPWFEEAKDALEELVGAVGSAEFEATMERWQEKSEDMAAAFRQFVEEDGPAILALLQDIGTAIAGIPDSAVFKLTVEVVDTAGKVIDFIEFVNRFTDVGMMEGAPSFEDAWDDFVPPPEARQDVEEFFNFFDTGGQQIENAARKQEIYNAAFNDFFTKHADDLYYRNRRNRLEQDAARHASEAVTIWQMQTAAAEAQAAATERNRQAVQGYTSDLDRLRAIGQEAFQGRPAPTSEVADDMAAPAFDTSDFLAQITELGPAMLDQMDIITDAVRHGFVDAEDVIAAFVQSGTTDFGDLKDAFNEEMSALQEDMLKAFSLPPGDKRDAAIAETAARIDHLRDIYDEARIASDRLNASAGSLTLPDFMSRTLGIQDMLGGVQGAFEQQGSEYQSLASSLTDAYDQINAKREQGIALSQDELRFLDQYPGMLQRLEGGMRDAAIQEGMVAAARTEAMLAQEALNAAIASGESNLAPYEERLRNAQDYLSDIDPASGAQQAIEQLDETLQDLTRTLREIAGLEAEPTVTLDTADFDKDGAVTRDEMADIDASQATPSVELDKADWDAKYDDVTSDADTLDNRKIGLTIEGDNQPALTSTQKAREEVTDFASDTYRAQIEADNQSALTSIGEATAQLDDFIGTPWTATINADASDALADIDRVNREMRGLPDYHMITIDGDIRPLIDAAGQARGLLPSSPAEWGPFSQEPDWAWVFSGAPDAAARAMRETSGILEGFRNALGGDVWSFTMPEDPAPHQEWADDTAEAIADAFRNIGEAIASEQEFIERQYDEFGAFLDNPRVIRALVEQQNALRRELELARIAGEETVALEQALQRLDGLLQEYAVRTGQSAADVAASVRDNLDLSGIDQAWKDALTEFSTEDIATGEALRQAQESVDELWRQLQLAQQAGAPQTVIDSLASELEAAQERLVRVGDLMGTSVMQSYGAALEREQQALDFERRFNIDFSDGLSAAERSKFLSEGGDAAAEFLRGMEQGLTGVNLDRMLPSWDRSFAPSLTSQFAANIAPPQTLINVNVTVPLDGRDISRNVLTHLDRWVGSSMTGGD